MTHIILQITEQAVTAAAQDSQAESMNLFSLVLKGGPIMIPLAILSVISVYITVERYLTLKKANKLDANFMANIKDMVLSGNIKGAKALCDRTDSPIARMLGKGISTVTGMVTAFYNMSQEGANLTVSLLAGGIYEALVTTVAGLIIGIFAYIAYNQLTTMIEKIVHQMEATSVEFIDLLQDPA